MKKTLIRMTESDLRNIVKNSVAKMIKEGWEDEYNEALDKRDFEIAYEKYKNEPWFKRFIKRVAGRSPKDPNPGVDSRTLANKYSDTYNDDEAFRNDYSDGSAVQTRMGYHGDTLDPVFSTIHRGPGWIDPQIHKSRVSFDRNGNPSEMGLTNYEDEAGFYEGMPDKESAGQSYGARGIVDRKRNEVGDAVKRARSKRNESRIIDAVVRKTLNENLRRLKR